MEHTNLHTRLKKLNLSTTLMESHPRCLELVESLEGRNVKREFDKVQKYFKWQQWTIQIKATRQQIQILNSRR